MPASILTPSFFSSFFLYDKIKSSINLYKAYEPIAIVKKTHKKTKIWWLEISLKWFSYTGQPKNSPKEPEDQGDRKDAHLQHKRGLHITTPQVTVDGSMFA